LSHVGPDRVAEAMTPRDENPIVCALDAQSMASRIIEWRNFVASSVLAVESERAAVRLVLRDSDAALLGAVWLGHREKQCCAFFDVAIELEADRRCLVFRVPLGTEAALAPFTELITP
jgi:hypothetical protein